MGYARGFMLDGPRARPYRWLRIVSEGTHRMTDFKDRERAEEAKFALDNETAFRLAARRNRLLGEWAAGLMQLTPEETDAYRKAVVQADFEESGDEDVVRKLLGDLTGAAADVGEADIRAKLEEMTIEARRQLFGEV